MNEKWAVAFESDRSREGMFVWARTEDGELAVFERKTDAFKWVLACSDGISKKGEVVYIKISPT